MLVPYEWLKEYVENIESPEEVAEALTLSGLETVVSGEVLEIDVTPNRGDCLSVVGVAREVAAVLKRRFRRPSYHSEGSFKADFRVVIDSPLCRRYSGRVLKRVKVGESPEWMKRRLEAAGIRAINNVVDITNYVMLEMGQPLHAFDLKTLRNAMIRVDIAAEEKEFITLDGQKRLLRPDTLLIWDGERPVAIAGVMGGEETEVTEKTTEVFLESAYFEPSSIRRTSKTLGLRTESSIRFERGIDISGVVNAIHRATELMTELCGAEASEIIDNFPYPIDKRHVSLSIDNVQKLLGIRVPEGEITTILNSLGFEIRGVDGTLEVTVPSFRPDIVMEADLIEEIARVYGYQNIPSVVPVDSIEGEPTPPRQKRIQLIREIMLYSGFNEAINYSFMSPQVFQIYSIPDVDTRRKTVEILNPLRKDENMLRTFLLPSLVDNLLRNLNRGVFDVKLFELSRVFFRTEEPQPQELLTLGAIYFYRRRQRLWESDIDVYYLMKGIVDKIAIVLSLEDIHYSPTDEPFLHPGRSADVYLGERRLGYVGVLSPDTKQSLDIGELKEDIGVLELNIEELLEAKPVTKTFTPLPRYPYVQRDVSLLISKDLPVTELLRYAGDFQKEVIEEVRIFDVYEGGSIPEGMRSVGITVIYRAKDRTLTDEEVDSLHRGLIEHLSEKTGARLR